VLGFESSTNFRAKNEDNVIVLSLKSEGQEREVTVKGAKGTVGEPTIVKIGKLEFTFSYGSKIYNLPFSIKLNNFIAKKYPGTEKSFSSFESDVTVVDSDKKFDTQIYMNHVLDYKGFRFFNHRLILMRKELYFLLIMILGNLDNLYRLFLLFFH